jgi:hypothetical protein
MLMYGIAVAFAFAAADRARRREASPALWGGLTAVLCIVATAYGGLPAGVPGGMLMLLAAAKMGKNTRECPACGKMTPIAALACPHCGASPRSKFISGI